MNLAEKRNAQSIRRWALAGFALLAGGLVVTMFLLNGDGTEPVQEAAHADEPIDFMSSNREEYRALDDPATLARIVTIEERLSGRTGFYVLDERIADVASSIRDGDIIAITSALRGLDVAHTGFAVWIDGRLHFMNAPPVGKDVRLSDLRLAERVARIEGQDGIMVARPLEP